MRARSTLHIEARPPLAWADKASTLVALAARLRSARVPDSLLVTRAEWRRGAAAVRRAALSRFGAVALAVRSARADEDAQAQCQAGRYLSLLGVRARDGARFARALRRVFASYGRDEARDAVLLQPCVTPVTAVVVASNVAPHDGAPYLAISRAACGDSTAITRGAVAADTWYLARATRRPVPRALAGIARVLAEVESLLGPQPFELELAASGSQWWLLQARPLPLAPPPVPRHAATRRALQRQRAAQQREGAPLLALMPDWNPAELLGEHPRPLALGLFQRLIGDGTWTQARQQLGYAAPYRKQLLRPLAGRPYVDVRASFESLLPAALPAALRARLVRHQLATLRAHPERHDKVEFSIALAASEFDIATRLQDAPLSSAERCALREALRVPTVQALDATALAGEIAHFQRRCEALAQDAPALALQARDLALPFARAARRDFVASALLRSAVRRGAIAPERLEALQRQARTGASEIAEAAPGLDVLRPGTFEIDGIACEAAHLQRQPLPEGRAAPRLLPAERRALDPLLREAGLPFNAEGLMVLAAAAMRARELGKRALARGLHAWLTRQSAIGATLGLDAATLGWLMPAELQRLPRDPARARQRAARAQARHRADALMRMPPLLHAPRDLEHVRHAAFVPNWMGAARIEAPLRVVDRHTRPEQVAPGSALAIASADPGYDWIFTRAPAALLTAYGGPHSHMALRCADAGVPAALGLGPERFTRLCHARRVRLDTRRGTLEMHTD